MRSFYFKERMSIQRSVMEPFLIDTKDTHHQTCFLQLFRRICMLPLCDPLLTKGIDPSSSFFHIKSGISTLFITHETCGFHHCVIFVIISPFVLLLDGFSRIQKNSRTITSHKLCNNKKDLEEKLIYEFTGPEKGNVIYIIRDFFSK